MPLLTKTFDVLLAPLTWAFLLLVAGGLLRTRRPRLAWRAVALAGAVLLALSIPALADALMRWAEGAAPMTYRPDEVYDVTIVLGGVMQMREPWRDSGEDLTDAAERLTRTLELWRTGRTRNVLVSGGLLTVNPGQPSEAEQLARLLQRWGVPAGALAVETRSRNTRENAVESARIVAERGWKRVLLVTSAKHMPRALGCFRRAGLSPDALPVDYRGGAVGTAADFYSWLPRAEDLSESTDAIHELAGRVYYRLAGYTRD